ncbi:MAG: Bug family tripartite tricarboxylate transporter substrate binding protein, partial [Ramlibacter sp.]
IYPFGTALPLVQAGAVRALATTGPRRSPALPDVPTITEAGFPMAEAVEWFGVFLPARTTQVAIAQLHSAISDALRSEELRTTFAKLSVEPIATSPGEFARLIKSDFERWGPVVRASGFTPEE